jgi:AcrR family transcriptional regulator
MTSLDRRLRHKQQIRQQILDVSKKIANQEGWSAVTMRRIATAIEYTLPVIYTHFKSKEEIIATLASFGFLDLKEQLESKSGEKFKSSKELLLALGQTYSDFATKEKALYAAMYGLEGITAINPQEAEDRSLLQTFLEEKLDELQKSGAKMKDPKKAAKILWANLHGLSTLDLLGILTPKEGDLNTMIAESINILATQWEVK